MTEILRLASVMLGSLYGPSFEYPILNNYDIVLEYASINSIDIKNPQNILTEEILSINGSNRYTIFYDDDTEFLVDKENRTVCHVSKGYSDYLNNDSYCLIFYGGDFYKYSPYENSLSACNSNIYYSLNQNVFLCTTDFLNNPCILNKSPSENAKLIDNWFYFKNLHQPYSDWTGYGSNRKNECAIIALQILLGYYDTFYNDNIVDEKYDNLGICKFNSTKLEDFSSPSTGTRTLDDPFKDYLKSFCIATVDDFGATCDQLASMCKHYLNTRYGVEYSTVENWVLDVPYYAKNMIDNNHPVILCGAEHAVVAYGYDDEYFYACDGLGCYSCAIPFSIYDASSISDIPSFFDFLGVGCFGINIHNHVHSNNYYSAAYDTYYCPCGEKIKKANISPNEWGFEAQYFFYEKNKRINKNSLSIETSRLRTGFIENEVVNLSPRRQNAGLSYLKLECNKNILKFSVDMGWWSEKENIEDASACLWYKDNLNENSWYNFCDIKNDLNLPTSYSALQTYEFTMPELSNGIMIYNLNNPLGDKNKGRLSIGDINIWYFE